jgi:hypothetical protein
LAPNDEIFFDQVNGTISSREELMTMDRGEAGNNTAAGPDNAPRPPRVPLPASVKINVEGAFIVDDEAVGHNGAGNDGIHYEHKDIRLPYHTAVVSHVAVDVRSLLFYT